MFLTVQNMQYFVTACSSFGLIFNTVLVIIICLCSSSMIGNYKYFLLAYTLVAILSCSIEVTILPMFHPTSAGWLFFSTVDRFPAGFTNILLIFYSISFIILMQILTLSFVYRYCIICREPSVDIFRKKTTLAEVLIFMTACTLICAYLAYTVFPSEYTVAAFDSDVFKATGMHLSKLAHMGGYVYKDGSWWTTETIAILGYALIMYFNLAIIIYCLVRILLFFRNWAEVIHSSNLIKTVQKRFVLLLSLQTIIPMIFTFSPVLISYVLCFGFIDSSLEVHVFYSCFQAVAQLLEPVIIITLLKEYRVAVKKVLLMKSTTT